jgi:hypothetical protein
MNRTMPSSLAAMMAAAIVCLAGTRAVAQPIPWNPPCEETKVVNLSPCNAIVTFTTTLGNVGPVTVPSGGSTMAVFAVGSALTGIITQAGAPIASVTVPGQVIPPPAWTAGSPSSGWVSNVTFGPPPGCCFDVYFDQSQGGGCYIWLLPTATVPPPPCTP